MTPEKIKQITKILTLEEFLAKYEGDDKIISSHELKKILDETPPNEFNFKTKIPHLDDLLEGVETGEMVVLSGKTGNGKTLLAQTLTRNFEKAGHKCLWFSYEIRYRNFFKRFGENLPLFYLPKTMKGKDISWIEKRIYEAKLKYQTNIIFIDHLGFLTDEEKKRDRRLEVDSLIRKLSTLCRTHNVLLFLLWHNKRELAGRSHEITEDDLKESSGIAQDSDIVLMIDRQFEMINGEKDYNVGKAKLVVAKSRRSGTMRKTVNLRLVDGMFEEEIMPGSEIKVSEIDF